MATHNLKTWMPFYQDVIDGRKTFELRKNDRYYQITKGFKCCTLNAFHVYNI
ncbi:MAG: DUF3850 domain-containing protein [Nostoc sp.]